MQIDFDFKTSPLYEAMANGERHRYCFDIEANGLLREVDEFFCAVVTDVDTGKEWRYGPDQVPEFLAKLNEARWLIAHNGIGYDFLALKKLFGWYPRFDQVIRDTLIMVRMYNPNLEMHPDTPKKIWSEHSQDWKKVGPHSLMNLGYIVGELKDTFGEEKAFDAYCPEMMEYCAQDVNVNVKVFHWLERNMKKWSPISLDSEMVVAKYIADQINHGWPYDIEAGDKLHNGIVAEMDKLERSVHATFGPVFKPKSMEGGKPKMVKPKFLTGKTIVSSVGLKNIYGADYLDYFDNIAKPDGTPTGQFTALELQEFNLGSRQQIAERLTKVGYKFKKFTPKTSNGGGGNPIVDDDVLKDAANSGIPEAMLLGRYFLEQKREAMVRNWQEKYDWDTGCIHGYVNPVGAITGRMLHSNPNVAQTPAAMFDKEGHPIFGPEGNWGADCRNLFTVKPGYTLVGSDASGLELRCLAHYMGDPEYTDLILHGDIHSHNQKLAGLPTRNNAKTFIYGYLYGAGDAKIGQIVGGTSKQGKELKTRFLAGLPKLKQLQDKIKYKLENQHGSTKYLKGLDGRVIRVRHAHAALNSLLQSCGAIICKYWLIAIMQNVEREGLDVRLVASVHDEYQFMVADKDVERMMEICEGVMPLVGEYFNTRCKLEAEAKSGPSWVYTH